MKVMMKLTIETDREDDGRRIAEVPELPGVLAYGAILEKAMAKGDAARAAGPCRAVASRGSEAAAMTRSAFS